jgi:hypothetical protein
MLARSSRISIQAMVPFVEVILEDDDSRPQVTLKVCIDQALGDKCSNLTKIKMDMLEGLHGWASSDLLYLHTCYLLNKLVFTKQGITGEKDCFKHLCIFESLLGSKMMSMFASLLGRAVEKVSISLFLVRSVAEQQR